MTKEENQRNSLSERITETFLLWNSVTGIDRIFVFRRPLNLDVRSN